VPEVDVILAQQIAKKHFFSVANVWEVHKAAPRIFDLDAFVLDHGEKFQNNRVVGEIATRGRASTIAVKMGYHRLGVLPRVLQISNRGLQTLKLLSQPWQLAACFFQRKVSFELFHRALSGDSAVLPGRSCVQSTGHTHPGKLP